MTPQEIFDTVATHLFAQGEQAMANSYCAYRADNGFRCAIGRIIPDELYDPSMEHKGILEIVRTHPLPDYLKSNASLLDALQVTHDDPSYWANDVVMKTRLATVATRYCLDSSVLDSLSFPRKP